MNGTFWDRINWWLCRKFGHKPEIKYDSPGGGDPEVCKRCDLLMSTAYSRERDSKR